MRDAFKTFWNKAKGWFSRLRRISPSIPLLVVLGLVSFAMLAGLVLWKVPEWQVPAGVTLPRERAELENEFRRTVAQILAGALVLIGASATGIGVYYTARRVRATERTVEVAQEQQITERFTRAIEQLGNQQSMAIRLGGIYALERIAKDSKPDHWQVMEVLTAYVRENARWEGARDEHEVPVSDEFNEQRVPTDIQAILTVLGRRNAEYDPSDQRLDLSDCNLRWADLNDSNLGPINLAHANLEYAFLSGAKLEFGFLLGTNLANGSLEGTNLSHACLMYSNLANAVCESTKLSAAALHGANFDGANLKGEDLSGAMGLTQEQLNSAIIDEHTILPDHLKKPQAGS